MNTGYAEQFPNGMDEFTKKVIADMERPKSFQEELEILINRHSKESGSNTPDFILCEYLLDCLSAFNKASKGREKWYGKELIPGVQ